MKRKGPNGVHRALVSFNDGAIHTGIIWHDKHKKKKTLIEMKKEKQPWKTDVIYNSFNQTLYKALHYCVFIC